MKLTCRHGLLFCFSPPDAPSTGDNNLSFLLQCKVFLTYSILSYQRTFSLLFLLSRSSTKTLCPFWGESLSPAAFIQTPAVLDIFHHNIFPFALFDAREVATSMSLVRLESVSQSLGTKFFYVIIKQFVLTIASWFM